MNSPTENAEGPQSAREWFEAAMLQPIAQRTGFIRASVDDAQQRDALLALIAAHEQSHRDDPILERIQAAAHSTVESITLPERLGSYRIAGLLGEGGMGTVWEGVRDDGEFRKRVAIKIIRGMPSPAARERLKRERQVLAGLEHANIARLYDGGTTPQGEPYLIMEFVDGMSLGLWMAQKQPSLDARLVLFEQLCRAVHAAHQQMIVHCDLKPSNVMVRADGSPVLLDFGIARLIDPAGNSRTATLAATPAYASPEQLAGQPVTLASDIFGLGIILYELLAGRVPDRRSPTPSYDGELPSPSFTLRHTRSETPMADIPADVESITRCAIRIDAVARYSSAAALADDIARYRAHLPVAAAGTHWRYVTRKFVRRHRIGVGIAALIAVALVGMTYSLFLQRQNALSAERAAQQQATAARETARFLQELYSELDPKAHPGRSLDARQLLDLGAERLKKRTGLSDEVRARLQVSLAEIYDNIGKPDAALQMAEPAYKQLQKAQPNDRDTLEAARLYAIVLINASRHADSIIVVDQSLPAAIALQDETLQADLLALRGLARQTLGRDDAGDEDYAKADMLYRRAGQNGLEGLAVLLHRRATAAEMRNDYVGALELYQRSLKQKMQLYARDDPRVLGTVFGVGKTLVALGRNVEARAMLQDLAERSERVHGPRTAPVQLAVAERAAAERDLGDFGAATRDLQEALTIDRLLQEKRDTIQASLHTGNLALIAEQVGDYDHAMSLMDESIAIRRRILDKNSPWIARSLHQIARLQLLQEKYGDAASSVADALVIRVAILPPLNPERLLSEALAIEINALHGTPDKAALDAVVGSAQKVPFPPLNLRIAVARASEAVDAASGRHPAALLASEQEIAALSARHPKDHPMIGLALLRRAELLDRAGNHAEAIAQARSASDILLARTDIHYSLRAKAASVVAALKENQAAAR
ncbi:MAG: serine/threonine-protein kinase [Dokdonella sp.]